jgi:uncharacterized protein YqjF (DUF2071 family)
MTQSWHDLLFAHWPVERAVLDGKIPPPLELEAFDNRAWIGVVPFLMTNVGPRGVPLPRVLSSFPEVNVRTYVRVADRPGVFFFSLDAGSALAVFAARSLLNLPYHAAEMRIVSEHSHTSFVSRRRQSAADLEATYGPAGPVFHAQPGTLDYFLTERYCLYGVSHFGAPYRLEIHHAPWPLQRAEATLTKNTLALASGLTLPSTPPLLHFAKRQDVVAWLPRRVR